MASGKLLAAPRALSNQSSAITLVESAFLRAAPDTPRFDLTSTRTWKRVVITKGIGMAKKQTSVRKREREAAKRQKAIEKTRKNTEKRERRLAEESPVEYVELKY